MNKLTKFATIVATTTALTLPAFAADVAALLQQVQQMQQQFVELQNASQAQQTQMNDQLTLARDRVVTLEGNLQCLDHTNQQFLYERKESIYALRGLPAALLR